MKIIIVGLGSMGKRRARLIRSIMPESQLVGVDTSPVRCAEALQLGFTEAFADLEEAIKLTSPDCVCVCTSPLTHAKIINVCLDHRVNVFSELNLVQDGYIELMRKSQENGCVLFLSSTLLYRKDIEHMISVIGNRQVNYVYHVGQYLPDWHPWESYKDFFVQDKRTNGCREIFAIELPWITRAMGPIKDMHVMHDKMSSLDLEYSDNYIVSTLHENGSKGSIIVDVVSRKAVRKLDIFSEDIYFEWSGTPQSLYGLNLETKTMDKIETYLTVEKNVNYSDNIIENAYVDELIEFFAVVAGETSPRYSFRQDLEILDIIDRIERPVAK